MNLSIEKARASLIAMCIGMAFFSVASFLLLRQPTIFDLEPVSGILQKIEIRKSRSSTYLRLFIKTNPGVMTTADIEAGGLIRDRFAHLHQGDKLKLLISEDFAGRDIRWIWELVSNNHPIISYTEKLQWERTAQHRLSMLFAGAGFLSGLVLLVLNARSSTSR